MRLNINKRSSTIFFLYPINDIVCPVGYVPTTFKTMHVDNVLFSPFLENWIGLFQDTSRRMRTSQRETECGRYTWERYQAHNSPGTTSMPPLSSILLLTSSDFRAIRGSPWPGLSSSNSSALHWHQVMSPRMHVVLTKPICRRSSTND